MSHARNASTKVSWSAAAFWSGRSAGGTTWISGSTWTMRASGSTSRSAFTPAIDALHNATRSFSRPSRVLQYGATQPHSPPAKAKKVISLIGVNQ
jgi:hypothetical protein